MADRLGEDEVRVADPPVVEAHGEAGESETRESQDRDQRDLYRFLLGVCVGGEQRYGVSCEVVGSVESPEPWYFVHRSVVTVEEQVQENGVEGELHWEPVRQADGFCLLVCKKDCEEGTSGCSEQY